MRPGADAVVDPTHDLGGFLRNAAVLRRSLPADLPRPVHLVAEAPELDVVRLLVAVRAAQIRVMRAAGMIAVLEELARFVRPARSEVHGEHRLHIGHATPIDEFVRAELIGLGRSPREIQPRRPLVLRPDAVLPVVARKKIAAGIAHDRRRQAHASARAHRDENRACRRSHAGLIDPAIHAPTHMLDERTEHAAIELGDDESRDQR